MKQRALVFTALVTLLGACPVDDAGVDDEIPADPCSFGNSAWAALEGPNHSPARLWSEMALVAIRRDLPQPTVHARNLFHLSAAMFDAWATYDVHADGVFFTEKSAADDLVAARAEAISYAAYRVLVHRYLRSAGGADVLACFAEALRRQGYEPRDKTRVGTSPRAIGNRIGALVISSNVDDGANEANGYADTTGWVATNQPLAVTAPGAVMATPDHWQPLTLAQAFTQNGISLDAGVQPYIGAHWKHVAPFALKRQGTAPYHDAGPAPLTLSEQMRTKWVVELIRKESQLEVTAETLDVSPGQYGNNPLGSNEGHGHALNPASNAPYAANVVKLGDFGRVMAEFWADGPNSETPPGHWNVLANLVADDTRFTKRLFGQGEPCDPLEWDVKVFLTLNGALHDAAITAWEVKREFTSARPISIIRFLAAAKQLPLIPGLIEEVTTQSSAAGQRHADLSPFVGEIAVKGWLGEGVGGVGWVRAQMWVPYQRKTFVTPAFPGFVSGHSTFSRSAAEVLTALTGSPFFPGGMTEYRITRVQFEEGPSAPVLLQWATYYDAADQAGQSRLWGGIHLEPDDFVGRTLGRQVGLDAVALARKHFEGTARP